MSLFRTRPSHKILFVAPEAAPFSKAGGLGEVMFALPRALRKIGYDARVMIPRYASIEPEKFRLATELDGLVVPTGAEGDEEPKELICNIKKFVPDGANGKNGKNGRSSVPAYFLENEEYYEKRSNIYGYEDDAVRWALLCRGVLEFVRVSEDWIPDVIVASDWQTGFLLSDLHTRYKADERLRKIATVFMVHNLSYQGNFDHRFIAEMDFDDGHSPVPPFFNPRLFKINGMRRGIMHADVVTTVSPTYAREIMTVQFGELLDDLLRERRSRVYGVLNGIDYDEFDPATDQYLEEHYDRESLDRRAENKKELQARFGLEENPKTFLLSVVSRLTEQKGFDLLFSVADALVKELNLQLVVQGAGESKYMGFFKELENRYPGRVGTNLAFDPVLPRLVYAGADAILIPSKFEPAGLTQIEAMRYGAVPIVRRTGGLADTVDEQSGFSFKDFDSLAMMVAVTRAYETYRHPAVWRAMQKRAMENDFSWVKSANEYARIVTLALAFRQKEINK